MRVKRTQKLRVGQPRLPLALNLVQLPLLSRSLLLHLALPLLPYLALPLLLALVQLPPLTLTLTLTLTTLLPPLAPSLRLPHHNGKLRDETQKSANVKNDRPLDTIYLIVNVTVQNK